jgi:hypothetical protein
LHLCSELYEQGLAGKDASWMNNSRPWALSEPTMPKKHLADLEQAVDGNVSAVVSLSLDAERNRVVPVDVADGYVRRR